MLRGVALCGIVWLNVPAITHFSYGSEPVPVHNLAPWLEPLLRGRFIGLFAALFGVSFALILNSARQRHPRPRLVLVRRLGFLLGLGVLHSLLQPGEVLTEYALFGLLLLLPLSYLRWRWVPPALGVAALLAAALMHLEPGYNDLGMMLLGFGAARLGWPARWEHPGRGTALTGVLLLPAYTTVLVLQQTVTSPVVNGSAAAYTWADFAAGVVGAVFYGTVIVLLLRTRLRPVIRAVFEPLGRLALSNYLGATLLAVLARVVLDATSTMTSSSTAPDLLVSAAIPLIQVPVSRWWLTRFRFGPAEWLWRCATWWQRLPNRRQPAQSTPASA